MESILRSLGFAEKQIQDALKHCKSVEEAILYLPDAVACSRKRNHETHPEPYSIKKSNTNVIDLTTPHSEDEDEKKVEHHVHFRGDTLFVNYISEIHTTSDKRYFNFHRVFSTKQSLKHDDSISHVFLSSFVYSTDLLNDILSSHPEAEITFSNHFDPESSNRDPRVSKSGKHMIVFPPFPHRYSYGCFHAKLILIRFSDRLRVVISSANLCEEDWTEWSQCVWCQDFYNAPEDKHVVAEKKLDNEFRTNLITFLKQCKCPEDRVFNLLRGVFFSNVRVQLVTSVPGLYSEKNWKRMGHMRLREIIEPLQTYHQSIGIPTRAFSPILSLCSSIGTPSVAWLHSILSSCHGGIVYPSGVDLSDTLHMVYPTLTYVRTSRIGLDRAGSLILSRKTYLSKTFPKSCLKRFKDSKGRENSLPHAKYLMNVPIKNKPRLPWIYAGSHNFTRSAWGALQKQESQFVVNNYECGVVLLPKKYVEYLNNDKTIKKEEEVVTNDDFCEPVSLVFDSPCLPYRLDDTPFCV